MSDDFLRLLAAWALIHETADEGWKAAVERGSAAGAKGMEAGPDAFVDGLAAMVAREKESLRAALASGNSLSGGGREEETKLLEELRFEMGELRSRLESMEASLDAVKRSLESGGAVKPVRP